MAKAAVKRSIDGLTSVEKAGIRAASAIEKATQQAGVSTASMADKVTVAHTKSVAQRVKAEADAAQKIDVSLGRVQTSGIKLQDRLAKEAERGATARIRSDMQASAVAQREGDRKTRAAERDASKLDAIQDRLLKRDYARRVAFEKQKQQAAARASEAADAAFQRGVMGATGFTGALSGVAAGFAALTAGFGVIRDIATVFVDAQKTGDRFGQQMLDTLSSMRDIAAIKEKFAPDEADLAQFLKVRTVSGLTHAEAHDFQEELYNALGTVSKQKFSDVERAKLEISGGQLAARTGGGPGAVRTRATVMGLLPDFMPGKTTTAAAVTDMADAVDVILGKGAGSQQVATTQYQKLLTSLTSEKMAGFLHDPRQAAALNAIASKFGPEESATSTIEAVRQVRTFVDTRKKKGATGTQAETLKKANITEFDDPVQAMFKLFKFADTEFKGEAFDAALERRGFGDRTGNRRLAQFYEQYQKSNFANILKEAYVPVAAGKAEEKFGQFAQSDVGRDLMGQAKIDAAKVERGRRTRELVIQKQEAEAQLIAEGMEDTAAGGFRQKFEGVAAFGMKEGRDILIERRAIENARMQAGMARSPGRSIGGLEGASLAGGYLTGGLAGAIRNMFGLELGKRTAEAVVGDNARIAEDLKRIRESNEAMARQGKNNQGRAPGMLPAGAPRGGAVRP